MLDQDVTSQADARASQPEKIRVLLVTGGHGFEREAFLRVFHDEAAFVVTHLEHSGSEADAWLRADLDRVDAVVLYDLARDISDAQREIFSSLFVRGIGLVATHHALVSFQHWPDYERIIGGRYLEVAEYGGDPRELPSGYEHDVLVPVRVAAQHPVTAGLEDFSIRDEIYWGYRVGTDVTELLTTTHPKSGNPIAWTRHEGTSRVVYLQLGHGPSAYAHPAYRRLIANAIRYVAKR